MKLEVIATTLEDAIIAEQNGADRLELITGIKEGGLTPSYATIKQVLNNVSIPVHVMIRPHSRSFHYNEYDAELMLEDISVAKQLGASGVVLGMLQADNTINEELLQECLKRTGNMNVTFHRAFDEARDLYEAIETLKRYKQITHVLTSGGQNSVLDAVDVMNELLQRTANSSLTILAGSGLHLDTIENFINETGIQEVHFGSGVRINNNALATIDSHKLQQLKRLLVK
jgi:copper homeostasis protein